MKRNTATLYLESPGATTPVPWVDGAPVFSGFTPPTLGVLQAAWADFVTSGAELEIISDAVIVEPTPEPDWDGFNGAVMTDPTLNALMGTVLGLAPAIALGVPAALTQVSQNGPSAFALVFGALCQLGQATQDDRDAWATMAINYNLPPDFVAVVRGENE